MGLAEQIRAGAALKRSTTTLTTNATGSGSVDLGAAYAILRVKTSVPCRLRLYDNQVSRDDIGEQVRPFGITNVSASVALVGDLSMSVANVEYTIDPIAYGVVTDPGSQLSYYRIENATTPPVIQLTTYLLEDRQVAAVGGSQYVVENRRTLPSIQAALAANATASGIISDTIIPATYLLVSASLSDTSHFARLRLYNVSASLTDTAELARQFRNEPSSSVGLIVDMILTGSEITHFVPKIIGANLDNVGSNLILAYLDRGKVLGDNELYYHLENKGAAPASITASLHVYTLED